MKRIELLESFGVVLRMLTFLTLSIMGKDTPFLWMWIINTIDASILTYCAWKRLNRPYIAMNLFWFVVGCIGIWNSL
jgi:hypothetical protein